MTFIKTNKYKIIKRIISIALVVSFMVSDISFAIADASRTTMSPPLATSPSNDTDLKKYWAFIDISIVIGQILKLDRDSHGGLKRPRDLLMPMIEKRVKDRKFRGEPISKCFDIPSIEEIRNNNVLTGFSIQVIQNGHRSTLVYSLSQDIAGPAWIPIGNGEKVFVKSDLENHNKIGPIRQIPPDIDKASSPERPQEHLREIEYRPDTGTTDNLPNKASNLNITITQHLLTILRKALDWWMWFNGIDLDKPVEAHRKTQGTRRKTIAKVITSATLPALASINSGSSAEESEETRVLRLRDVILQDVGADITGAKIRGSASKILKSNILKNKKVNDTVRKAFGPMGVVRFTTDLNGKLKLTITTKLLDLPAATSNAIDILFLDNGINIGQDKKFRQKLLECVADEVALMRRAIRLLEPFYDPLLSEDPPTEAEIAEFSDIYELRTYSKDTEFVPVLGISTRLVNKDIAATAYRLAGRVAEDFERARKKGKKYILRPMADEEVLKKFTELFISDIAFTRSLYHDILTKSERDFFIGILRENAPPQWIDLFITLMNDESLSVNVSASSSTISLMMNHFFAKLVGYYTFMSMATYENSIAPHRPFMAANKGADAFLLFSMREDFLSSSRTGVIGTSWPRSDEGRGITDAFRKINPATRFTFLLGAWPRDVRSYLSTDLRIAFLSRSGKKRTSKTYTEKLDVLYERNLLGEGGAVIPSEAASGHRFVLVSSSASRQDRKALAWQLKKDGITLYSLPPGYTTTRVDNKIYRYNSSGHIDCSINIIRPIFTKDGRAKILIDPFYYNGVKTNPEFRRLIREQGFETSDIIIISQDDISLDLTNFAEIVTPSGEPRLIFNHGGTQTLNRLGLKDGIYEELPTPLLDLMLSDGLQRCASNMFPEDEIPKNADTTLNFSDVIRHAGIAESLSSSLDSDPRFQSIFNHLRKYGHGEIRIDMANSHHNAQTDATAAPGRSIIYLAPNSSVHSATEQVIAGLMKIVAELEDISGDLFTGSVIPASNQPVSISDEKNSGSAIKKMGGYAAIGALSPKIIIALLVILVADYGINILEKHRDYYQAALNSHPKIGRIILPVLDTLIFIRKYIHTLFIGSSHLQVKTTSQCNTTLPVSERRKIIGSMPRSIKLYDKTVSDCLLFKGMPSGKPGTLGGFSYLREKGYVYDPEDEKAGDRSYLGSMAEARLWGNFPGEDGAIVAVKSDIFKTMMARGNAGIENVSEANFHYPFILETIPMEYVEYILISKETAEKHKDLFENTDLSESDKLLRSKVRIIEPDDEDRLRASIDAFHNPYTYTIYKLAKESGPDPRYLPVSRHHETCLPPDISTATARGIELYRGRHPNETEEEIKRTLDAQIRIAAPYMERALKRLAKHYPALSTIVNELYPKILPHYIRGMDINYIQHHAVVMDFASEIAVSEGLSENEAAVLFLAALFHDSGNGQTTLPKITPTQIQNAKEEDRAQLIKDAIAFRREHMEIASDIAGNVLASLRERFTTLLSLENIAEIQRLVLHHDDLKIPMWEEHVDPKWLITKDDWLLQYLSEADTLWMLTAPGIQSDIDKDGVNARKSAEQSEFNIGLLKVWRNLYANAMGADASAEFGFKDNTLLRSDAAYAIYKRLTEKSRPITTSFIGLISGFMSGALGIGGGTVMVPLSVLLCRSEMKRTVGTALWMMIPLTLLGISLHVFADFTNLKLFAAIFAITGSLTGVYLGTELTKRIDSSILKGAFSGVLLLTGLKFLGLIGSSSGSALSGSMLYHPYLMLLGLAGGMGVALFGIGGGVLFVPMLNMFFGLSVLESTTTSLFIILPTVTVAAFLRNAFMDHDSLKLTYLIPLSLIGAITGVATSHILPAETIKVAFGIVLLTESVGLFYQTVKNGFKKPPAGNVKNSTDTKADKTSGGTLKRRAFLGLGIAAGIATAMKIKSSFNQHKTAATKKPEYGLKIIGDIFPERQTVIFVHGGFGGSSKDYKLFTERFAGSYNIVTFSYDDSRPLNEISKEFVDAVSGLKVQHNLDAGLTIVANSYGTIIAREAIIHQDASKTLFKDDTLIEIVPVWGGSAKAIGGSSRLGQGVAFVKDLRGENANPNIAAACDPLGPIQQSLFSDKACGIFRGRIDTTIAMAVKDDSHSPEKVTDPEVREKFQKLYTNGQATTDITVTYQMFTVTEEGRVPDKHPHSNVLKCGGIVDFVAERLAAQAQKKTRKAEADVIATTMAATLTNKMDSMENPETKSHSKPQASYADTELLAARKAMENFIDAVTYIQEKVNDHRPVIAAIGKDFIMSGGRDVELEHEIKLLMQDLRTFCASKNISLIYEDDDALLNEIAAARAEKGKESAKIVALASFRKDKEDSSCLNSIAAAYKDAVVIGVDNSEFADNKLYYIRIPEILETAFKYAFGVPYSTNPHIVIDTNRRFPVLIPDAEPIPQEEIERFKQFYIVQRNA